MRLGNLFLRILMFRSTYTEMKIVQKRGLRLLLAYVSSLDINEQKSLKVVLEQLECPTKKIDT